LAARIDDYSITTAITKNQHHRHHQQSPRYVHTSIMAHIQPPDPIAVGQAVTAAGELAQDYPNVIPPAQLQAWVQSTIQAAIGPPLAEINSAIQSLTEQLQEMGQQLNQRLTAVEEGLQRVQASLQEIRDRRDRV
jgi:hypothetical protein